MIFTLPYNFYDVSRRCAGTIFQQGGGSKIKLYNITWYVFKPY